VNFNFLIAARKRINTLEGELYVVTSGSGSSHKTAEDTLLTALGQPAWTLTLTESGASRAFACQMADVQRGESIQQALLTRWTTFQLTIPCRPA
jgi:hypothetical protein